MLYVFDTNVFIVIGHYFPESFPTFWQKINEYVENGKIVSTREVYNELDNENTKENLSTWVKQNKSIFLTPTSEELKFVSKLFSVPQYQQLVRYKQRLKGTPVADPFIIALAKVENACVVTEEAKKNNSTSIPNICEKYSIDCINLEGFMKRENWSF